jgi:hypothetical protein
MINTSARQLKPSLKTCGYRYIACQFILAQADMWAMYGCVLSYIYLYLYEQVFEDTLEVTTIDRKSGCKIDAIGTRQIGFREGEYDPTLGGCG